MQTLFVNSFSFTLFYYQQLFTSWVSRKTAPLSSIL